MKTLHTVLASATLASALLAAPAVAETSDNWQFGAMIYGYFPSVGGSTSFPTSNSGTDVNVDSSKIIDSLEGAFLGSFEARKGQWGAYTDFMYLNIGNSKTATRDFSVGRRQIPVDVAADVNYDMKGYVWTFAGMYGAVDTPTAKLDVLFGGRMLDLSQKLGWQLSGNIGQIAAPGRAGNTEVSDTIWDAIVGVKGRLAFGENHQWFIPYYLDIGTGQSDLTWQAMAGLGYGFKWGEIVAGWRYLDYNLSSDSRIESVNFNGPMAGVAFHW